MNQNLNFEDFLSLYRVLCEILVPLLCNIKKILYVGVGVGVSGAVELFKILVSNP